jgi:phenylpropionate dioxygenase-like ring-hydroxylating dioxygenase large terminal subunit
MNELLFVLRGKDGTIRAFHNVCRHRAARLLDNATGDCGGRIVCPYHAWTYDLEGRLIGVPGREFYPDLDQTGLGLKPLAMGQCGGFVFVRPAAEGPTFDDFIAPLREEFGLYRTADMKPFAPVRLRVREVNWKVATDNYIDALHIPVAHPGLSGLANGSYDLDVKDGVYRFSAYVGTPTASQSKSVQAYAKYLPHVEHLPNDRQRRWVYALVWPNLAFDIYPDQIDYMQFIPLSPTRTLLRETAYALPDTRRDMKAARYLNWRINRDVNLEDKDLIERVQAGLGSSSFASGPFGANEVCLRDFADRMRAAIPLCGQEHRPSAESYKAALANAGGAA